MTCRIWKDNKQNTSLISETITKDIKKKRILLLPQLHYVTLLFNEDDPQEESDCADSMNLLKHSNKKKAEGADNTYLF